MHKKEMAVGLKLCRNVSGLTGDDLSHLLQVSEARVSRLQNGHASPTCLELSLLSMIYGNQACGLFRSSDRFTANILQTRLATIPDEPEKWKAHDTRLDTLNDLTARVRAITQSDHDATSL